MAINRQFRYFAIFASPRTGSNLLQRQLDQVPDITCHGELFNPAFIGQVKAREFLGYDIAARDGDPVGFLERMIEEAEDQDGGIPGFRIFPGHDARMLAYAAEDPSCAKIILRRPAVESFISQRIAETTGQWMLTKPDRRKTARIRFDPASYDRYAAYLEAHNRMIDERIQVAGAAAFRIEYSDLHDPDILNGAAQYLGSEHRMAGFETTIHRQNPAALVDKVENPLEMTQHLRGAVSYGRRAGGDRRRSAASLYEPTSHLAALGGTDNLLATAFGDCGEHVLGALAAADGVDPPELTRPPIPAFRLARRKRRGGRIAAFATHPTERLYASFMSRIFTPGPLRREDARRVLAANYAMPTPLHDPVEGADAAADEYDAGSHATAFAAFVRFVDDNINYRTAASVDVSWLPQSALLARHSTDASIDYVGRTERLERDLGVWLALLGREDAREIAMDAAARLAAERAAYPFPLADVIDEETVRRVQRVYLADYHQFGYAAR